MRRLVLFADFNPPRRAADIPTWLASFGAVPWTDVIIGVNTDEPRVFSPHVPADAVARCVEALHRAGIVPWVMPWIHRNPDYIRAAAEYGAFWAGKYAAGVLFDAEWGWIKGRVSMPADDAAALLGAYTGSLPLWGVTSYGKCPAAVVPVTRLPGCVGFAQTYEIHNPSKGHVYPPGTLAAAGASTWAGCAEYVPCAALWALNHPAPHARGNAALGVSLDAAARHSGSVAFWSRKWLRQYPGRLQFLEKRYNVP